MAGKFDKAKGRAKEAIGRALKNPRLEREGRRDQDVGEVKEQVQKVKDKVGRAIDRTLHPEEYGHERGERDE